jgi:hypothetical protein
MKEVKILIMGFQVGFEENLTFVAVVFPDCSYFEQLDSITTFFRYEEITFISYFELPCVYNISYYTMQIGLPF